MNTTNQGNSPKLNANNNILKNTKSFNTKEINNKKSKLTELFTPTNNETSNLMDNALLFILVLVLAVGLTYAVYKLTMYIIKIRDAKIFATTSTVNVKPVETKEVFHIADNIFTFNEAGTVCKAVGAELATEEQIVDAYKKGANWCSYGWVKSADGKSRAYYPIQKDFWDLIQNDKSLELKDQCGVPGVNGGPFDRDTLFGVNCYGVKREPTREESELTATLTASDTEDKKVAEYKGKLAETIFAPFAPGRWSGL